MTNFGHEPVMPKEVMDFLHPSPGDTVIDATLGLGGHADLLGKAIGPTGMILGADWDEEMLKRAKERLSALPCRMQFVHCDFRHLPEELGNFGYPLADCILLDLGVSSAHLDEAERGFAFRMDGPLDMRMDRGKGETAEEMLARMDEREMERIIKEFGEDRWAKAIAKQIAARRGRMRTTKDLVEAVAAAVPLGAREKRIHFATRTFQAIRIAVNREIEGLSGAVEKLARTLKLGGRMVVLSYHSLEDREVKHAFQKLSGKCVCPRGTLECRCGKERFLKVLTPKPVTPSKEEIERNPRSRSAKLRAAERIAA